MALAFGRTEEALEWLHAAEDWFETGSAPRLQRIFTYGLLGCAHLRQGAYAAERRRAEVAAGLIAEVELAEEPEWGLRRDARGIRSSSRMGLGVR